MSDTTEAVPAGPVVERSAGGSGPLSVWEAARSLADTRYKEQAQEEKQAEAPGAPAKEAAAPEPQESAEEADAAPPQEATGETDQASDPAQDEPLLDRP